MSQVVACWSPTPRQGTTFASILLAVAAMGKQKTLLIDANFTQPMVAKMIGVDPTHRIEQLFPFIAGGKLTEEVFSAHLVKKGSLSILPGMGRGDLASESETADFMLKILQFSQTAFDLIIIDAGSGVNHAGSYSALTASDRVVVVLEPNHYYATLFKEWQVNIEDIVPKGLHAPRAGLVVNRWEKKLFVSKEEIATFCGLPLLAALPNDHVGFLNALNKGELWKHSGESMFQTPMRVVLGELTRGGGM